MKNISSKIRDCADELSWVASLRHPTLINLLPKYFLIVPLKTSLIRNEITRVVRHKIKNNEEIKIIKGKP